MVNFFVWKVKVICVYKFACYWMLVFLCMYCFLRSYMFAYVVACIFTYIRKHTYTWAREQQPVYRHTIVCKLTNNPPLFEQKINHLFKKKKLHSVRRLQNEWNLSSMTRPCLLNDRYGLRSKKFHLSIKGHKSGKRVDHRMLLPREMRPYREKIVPGFPQAWTLLPNRVNTRTLALIRQLQKEKKSRTEFKTRSSKISNFI